MKAKMEKVGDIKKINAQMMAIKSEISKNEDLLKEYMIYKQFLDKLTPREVMEVRARYSVNDHSDTNCPS